MNGVDATTWQALGAALTVVGLLISILLWKRRGPAAGLRGVAWSLLPLAAGLTGSLRLLWRIGDAVVDWAVRLVFSPIVWVGVVVAGVAVVLFGVSGAMRARGVGTGGRPPRKAEKEARTTGEPATVSGTRSAPAATPRSAGTSGRVDDGMEDIEAILRKHGIS